MKWPSINITIGNHVSTCGVINTVKILLTAARNLLTPKMEIATQSQITSILFPEQFFRFTEHKLHSDILAAFT